MKGYSLQSIPENCARARLEGVNASYKELAEVCGRIRNKKTDWAVEFLQQVSEGGIPVLFKRHNRNMGHRHEVGGRKGRYPKKAAHYVLKTLKSAIANGKTLGLGESYTILTALANKKDVYPRLAPKGRQSRSYLETARIEIVLKGEEIPKGVTVTPPKKPEKKAEEPQEKKEVKTEAQKKPKAEQLPKPKAEKAKTKPTTAKPPEQKAEVDQEQMKEANPEPKNNAPHQHKHESEKTIVSKTPHEHGESTKG